MAEIKIPTDSRVFSQPNDGKLKGNLNSTFNIDLVSSPGKLNVSSRLSIITSSNSSDTSYITTLGYPVAIKYFAGRWRFVGGTDAGAGKIYINDGTTSGVFSADGATSSPTDLSSLYSDLEIFNSKLYTSAPFGNLKRQASDGATWANVGGATATLNFNFLKTGPTNRLYYPNTNYTICYMNTSESHTTSGNGTITLLQPPTCATVTENRMWIGTAGGTSLEGTVVEWDMSDNSQSPNATHKIGTTATLALCAVRGIPYAVCSDGTLKVYSGGAFVRVAQFPSFALKGLLDFSTTNGYNTQFIHPNGMSVVNGMINFMIRAVENTSSTTNLFPEMSSGVWEFDPENPSKGIYHKFSVTIDSAGANDHGQFKITRPGFIVETKQTGGSVLVGAGYYTDNSTTHTAIFRDDLAGTYTKRGIFNTPEMFTGDETDTWQKATMLHEPFLNSTDKIISKYKIASKNHFPFVAAITWTSTTTFTTTDSNFQYVVVGDEVFVAFGKGGGTTSHVSIIDIDTVGATTTYTITIDEANGYSSGTATVIMDNWKKINTSNTQSRLYSPIPMTGVTEPKIQYRFEVRGQGDSPEINQFILQSTKQK